MDTSAYHNRDYHLVLVYGKCTFSATDVALKDRHMVLEAAEADRYYAIGQYAACQQACYCVLEAQPSEAIQARCHEYLASEAVGPEEASGRVFHAESAVRAWQAVIDRTGLSKFPIEEAKEQLQIAKRLLHAANEALAADGEEPEPLLT